MAQSKLDIVIRMAEERRDDAARQLAEGRQRMQDALDQIQQLEQYQQQYVEQNRQESTRGISVQSLAEARRFIAELSDLIGAQQNMLASREAEVDALTNAWTEASRYLQAVEKLAMMRANEEQLAQIKREQQMQDDLFAQRRGRHY